MTLSVKRNFNNYGAALTRPCCDYSHLIAPQASQSEQKTRILWLSLIMLSSLFIAELGTGLWSRSLSLLADAGHLLSDLAAMGLTLIANRLAQRPTASKATFGHGRVEIMAALANGVSLLAIAAIISREAVGRFQSAEIVSGLPMLVVAGVSLAVNSLNITLLHKASRNDLNLRGAFLHVLADTASSAGIILAALAVYFLNWTWLDAVASLLIACFISLSALPLIKESWEILMEYAPRSIDPLEVEAYLNSFAAVESVEKLHIWTITSGQVALSAHLVIVSSSGEQRDRLLGQLQTQLEQEFGIRESTLQITSSKSKKVSSLHPLLNSNLINLSAQKHADCDCQW